MQDAIDLALENIKNNGGGPFGAVVVRNGEIVGRGANHVTTHNDPTAHAEVEAIRDACKNLKTFQLDDCEIYASCEPCPMCLGAIYWARLKKLYFASTREDAARIGFDDSYIYQQLPLSIKERDLNTEPIMHENGEVVMKAWENDEGKVEY